MSIATTVNLQENALEKLCEASEKTARSRSELIVLLMGRVMGGGPELLKSFCRIRYQERDPEGMWTHPHIRLREDEYEYAIDMRKFLKMSFSAIIAMAIEKYLDQIISDLLYPETANEDDNYRVKNYILVRESLDGILSWRIYWGIPLNLADIVPVTTE